MKPVFWLLIFSLIVFDQTTKNLAVKYLPTVCNRGFAFGFSPDWFSALIPVFVLLIILPLFLLEKSKHNLFVYALVLAGGFSNLIDRFRQGCVVDFIDLGVGGAFNVADAFISAGVVILAMRTVLNTIKK